MFFGCSSLISIPDISKFKGGEIDISYIFCDCYSLISLPNINYSKAFSSCNEQYTFNNCLSLTSSLPIFIKHEEEKYSEPGEWASMMGETGYYNTKIWYTFK